MVVEPLTRPASGDMDLNNPATYGWAALSMFFQRSLSNGFDMLIKSKYKLINYCLPLFFIEMGLACRQRWWLKLLNNRKNIEHTQSEQNLCTHKWGFVKMTPTVCSSPPHNSGDQNSTTPRAAAPSAAAAGSS